ncbi:AraC family transcriptional regulator [Spirosoma knui]
MKSKLESIQPDTNSSFRILLTPHLNDLFYWHYHPEYELVYIEGVSGTRHVGEHISTYEGSDLVFIGPNVPHLNFDYGVKAEYHEVVVQLSEQFLKNDLGGMPELADIAGLFERARRGISFNGETKQRIGVQLTQLLKQPPFRQLLSLLAIFQDLATTDECVLLNARPVEHAYNRSEQQRIRRIYQFVEENYARRIDLDEVADLTNLTKAAFCRYIKRMTRLTFTDFVNQYRISQAKKQLLLDRTVTEACFSSGFDSLSYFNRIFRKATNENPSQFKKRHLASIDRPTK